MSDLDTEINDYYADQELDPGFLDKLLQMEAEADRAAAPEPPAPANNYRGFKALGALSVAALALFVVGGGLITSTMLLATGSAPVHREAVVSSPVDSPADYGGEGLVDADLARRTATPDRAGALTGEFLPSQELPQGRDVDTPDVVNLQIIRGKKLGDRGAEVRDPFDEPNDGTVLVTDHLVNLPTGRNYMQQVEQATTVTTGAADRDSLLGVDANDGLTDELAQLGYLDKGDMDGDGRFANGLIDGRRGPARGWTDTSWRPSHTLTTTDHLSTFSVDTDTGAWTRSRRAISEGYLPNPAEVRPEEFINAFRYDYEGPTSGPFSVSTEVVPSPFDGERHLVRIGVQGKRISVFERKPVHLTFLVDVSGSMQSSDRLPLVRQGLKMLVGELRDGDTVALVTYAGNSRVVLEPTSVTDREAILRAIDRLSTSGGTAMGAGIDLAYGLAQQTLERGAINRVVLASDGDANVGETNADRLAKKLRVAADQGITLTTLGVGSGNYRDDVMERLADKGDGQYHYIGDERDARKVLVDELTGTLQTIARDVKLQIDFDPKVVSEWRQIGYDNRQIADRDFRNDRVDAGEVGSGHQVTALYEIKLVDPGVGSVLGDLRLRYEAPGAEGAPAVERAMKLIGTPRESLGEASDDTRVAVVAAAFAERLRQHPGPALSSLEDLLPVRPEYAETDGDLRAAIAGARRLGLQ